MESFFEPPPLDDQPYPAPKALLGLDRRAGYRWGPAPLVQRQHLKERLAVIDALKRRHMRGRPLIAAKLEQIRYLLPGGMYHRIPPEHRLG